MRYITSWLVVTGVRSTLPLCSDSDVAKIGTVDSATNVVVQCMGGGKTQQEIVQCISNDIPGLSSVSRDCLMCTAAVFSGISSDCINSCMSTPDSPTCNACITDLENLWSAACNNKSYISVRSFSAILFVIILSFI